MFPTALLILLACFGQSMFAQEPPCGLRSVTETAAPVYPPIGRAAHVSGTVVLLATFDLQGKVTEVHTVSGPQMLQKSAEIFVRGWQANTYTGPRACPIVVDFALAGNTFCTDDDAKHALLESPHRIDTQHYRITGYAYAICDPAGVLEIKRKRFGIF